MADLADHDPHGETDHLASEPRVPASEVRPRLGAPMDEHELGECGDNTDGGVDDNERYDPPAHQEGHDDEEHSQHLLDKIARVKGDEPFVGSEDAVQGREREGEDAVERNNDEQRLENGHLLWRETGVKTIDIEEYDHEGDGDEKGYRDKGLINNAQEHPDGILFALRIVLREKARDGISEPEIEQKEIDDGESEGVETVIVRTDARDHPRGVDEPRNSVEGNGTIG